MLKINKRQLSFRHITRLSVVSVGVLLVVGFTIVPHIAQADQYDDQIKALRDENNNKQNALSALKIEASSYQDAISQLQAQINSVQQQINENTARQNELQAKIDENKRELERQKSVLGDNIRVMYVEGEISTIEMLATSKDLSEFVDKEEYRTAVKNKIQATMHRITDLQNQMNEQKVQVERLLVEQRSQQNQLAYNRSEQARLLTYNQSQQNQFSQQMAANNQRIGQLKAQQAIENARLFGGGGGVLGGGGYPWGSAKCIHTGRVEGSCSNYDWAVNDQIWNYSTGGYGYRNCTDWVAWRTDAPGGLGNANQWDERGGAMGYTVSSTPRQGAAAVSNSGTYGHVMYVEAVDADGSILISDYNRAGTGLYSTATLERVGDGRYKNSSNGNTSTLVFVYL